MTQAETEHLGEEARILLDAYHKGQHTSLLAEVDELSKRGPLSPSVLGLAAASLVALERHDEAITASRQAVEQEPRWAWLYLALSLAEGGRGNWKGATESAVRSAALLPGEPLYLANLARCQRMTDQPLLAVETVRRALSAEPAHAESLNELGLSLEATGDSDGALSAFRQAEVAHPNDPTAFLNEGELHRRAGHLSQARRAFQEALRRDTHLTKAQDRLAESLSQNPLLRGGLRHLLSLGRFSGMGWAIVAFLYYLFFRLLEFLWRAFPILLPAGRALLAITLLWLAGGALAGWSLRAYLCRMR